LIDDGDDEIEESTAVAVEPSIQIKETVVEEIKPTKPTTKKITQKLKQKLVIES
jgi:hypothetical protein